jgi:hypothetical protein
MKMRVSRSYLIKYLALLVPSFLIIAPAWSIIAQGRLYYCSDWMPVIGFFPPFIHGSQVGDYFIAPEWVVYLVWVIAVIIILLLPLLFLKIKEGFHAERSKQNVVQSKSKLKKI